MMLTPKKVLISLVIVAAGFVACATKTPPSAPQPPAPTPVASAAPDASAPASPDDEDDANAPQPGPVAAQNVTADNVTFTIPASGSWHEMQPPVEEIISLWRDSGRRALLLVAKDTFKGNLSQFSLVTLKGMKESGGTLVSTKQVTINGTKMVQFVTNRGTTKITVVVAVKAGMGYNVMCGGPEDNDSIATDCQSILQSLKIN